MQRLRLPYLTIKFKGTVVLSTSLPLPGVLGRPARAGPRLLRSLPVLRVVALWVPTEVGGCRFSMNSETLCLGY